MDKYKLLPETVALIQRVEEATSDKQLDKIFEEVASSESLHPSVISHVAQKLFPKQSMFRQEEENRPVVDYCVDVWAADTKEDMMSVISKASDDSRIGFMEIQLICDEMQDKSEEEGW